MVRVMSELVKPLQCIKSESDDELEENEDFAPTPGSESPEPEEPPAAKKQRLEEYLPRVSLGGGQEGNPPPSIGPSPCGQHPEYCSQAARLSL